MQDNAVQEDAPAKINLTLHVTGQRADGYHLLDSLVVFADVGDRISFRPSATPGLRVTGPRAQGVPTDASNLVLRALALMGQTGEITLDKHLPAMAGIGGGSSDAAATLRAVARATGAPLPETTVTLGADVPVCMTPRATRMRGIGEHLTPLPALPPLHGVLINPGVDIPTPAIFRQLATKTNPPMPEALPQWRSSADLIDWLGGMRNDLEPPARALAPEVGQTLDALSADPACGLARMSGSGATCFGLTHSRALAEEVAQRLARPGWWVQPVTFC